MHIPTARNPRAAATALLPPGYEARVLEPSPPANTDPAWFADDPTDPGSAIGPVVTPIPSEGKLWIDIDRDRSTVTEFIGAHWLDGKRRLDRLPDGYIDGREALHQLAFFAVAPKRFQMTGKLGLRYTFGGFGTPFFRSEGESADEQIRIEADAIVHQIGPAVEHVPITTLHGAVEFLGLPYRNVWFDGFEDPPLPVDPHARLAVAPEVTWAVGDWFGFSTAVLERVRRRAAPEDRSRLQLWPEHFDLALDLGVANPRRHITCGASPGDGAHLEPYLYVIVHGVTDPTDDFWNSTGFVGALLGYDELAATVNPHNRALAFFDEAIRRLDR